MMKIEPIAIRYEKKVKQKIVHAIINGDLLLEEAMEQYEIVNKRTIVRWLKQYQLNYVKPL